MEQNENSKPPRFALAFFRWYCRPDLREEIEGDLLERFHKYAKSYGLKKARLLFIKETLLLIRPGIIRNIHHLIFKLVPDMKKIQWLQLIVLNVLVVLCMFLPFIPGHYDHLVLGLSLVAQLTGFLGLLLVPVGILWLIQEIKKMTGHNTALNNWSSGYYYAITATCLGTFFSLFLALVLLIGVGASAAVIALAAIIFALYKLIPIIKALKRKPVNAFNAAPLYLLSIPLIAFVFRLFFISAAGDYSRNYAIKQGQRVISGIENYYAQNKHYPESIDELYDLPKPDVMGIDEFLYERNGNAYNLSFVQWQHFGATREVVMYNKKDEHNVKGHFASYDTKQLHWRYYWLD